VIPGIRVPDGFATTSDAFFYFLKEGKLDAKIKEILKGLDINNMKELDKRSKKIRDLIIKTKLPKSLEEDILEHFVELQKLYKDKNISLAVRSSATVEDAADASFAGQHESYLNVVGKEDLLKAIKLCFSSLFTSRAIAYRNNLKLDHTKVGLSVGVQKMVRSDLACSGVMFSCDTESGFSDVVLINGSYGLGENIVKGRVETDEYYVYEKTLSKGFKPIIEKRMGKKE
jgi:pyruvate,water dikinase